MKEYENSFPPFKQGKELETQGTNTRHFKIENNPFFRAKRLDTTGQNFEEIQEPLERNLSVLKKYLGKFLPELYVTYSGKDRKNMETYIFMEEIDPLTPKNDEETLEYFKQRDECYGEAWRMCKETHLMVDLNNENFLFGISKKTGVKKLYFIDTYPEAEDLNPRSDTSLETLIEFYTMIEKDIQNLHTSYKYEFPITMTVLFEMEQHIEALENQK